MSREGGLFFLHTNNDDVISLHVPVANVAPSTPSRSHKRRSFHGNGDRPVWLRRRPLGGAATADAGLSDARWDSTRLMSDTSVELLRFWRPPNPDTGASTEVGTAGVGRIDSGSSGSAARPTPRRNFEM